MVRTQFVNSVLILPKKDNVRLVLDARRLNSITDIRICSWPLEPLQILMTKINELYFRSKDLSWTYNQVPLTDEAQKLTSLIVEGRQYTYQFRFYGLKPLPKFFSKLMRFSFGPLNKEKSNHLHRRHIVTESKQKVNLFYNSKISTSVTESQIESWSW